ncbi:MAG TPA: hypothetical protein PL017_10870 [Tenuifilaceae bacterium]|nr:hypothetical protein [Tenuifilaceae bacterium]HPE19535.1 hypothetical protein [Tenuifilaceae bacterium]HPJ46590.1 hypothetical protein [Tenuifilaceae bacterium]HPQ35597.1 hypothetical protein [Tenuifilaceae bacterium]HRX69139.1 hypothetical protein [Tenuifilaceae bacterium]
MNMKLKAFYAAIAIATILGVTSCDPFDNGGVTIEITENISESVTWETGNTYIIDGTIRISSNVTIEPGTRIEFKEGAALEFAYWDDEYVTVTAIGTEEKPIIFTSASSSPEAGDYDGLNFYSGANNCVFEHCTFEYGGKDEYYGTIHIEETNVKFTNCQFRFLKNTAIVLEQEGSFTQFTENTFSNIDKHAISIRANYAHTIGENNDFGVSANYGILISNDEHMDVAGSYTWLAHNAPYIIEGNLRIGAEGSGVNLTIAPGSILKFAMDKTIELAYWDDDYAKLIAKGTAEEPILFTSNSTAPAPGDYNGIYFYSGARNCEFEYATFEYGGHDEYEGAITIEETSVKFENCTFSNIKNTAIKLKKDGKFSQFTGNTFTNIEKYPIDIRANNVHTIGASNAFNFSGNYGILVNNDEHLNAEGVYTWLNHDAPYIIEGSLRIGSEGSGVNLTIEPGTTLRFMTDAGFEVSYWDDNYAKVIAEGTAEEPIIFTSNNPSPNKGDWSGLYFYSGVTGCSFKHCEILYAGSNTYLGAFMLEDSGDNTITLANSRIAYSNSHAITVDSDSSVDYSTVTFDNNNGENYHER